jgi:hypothetical protein
MPLISAPEGGAPFAPFDAACGVAQDRLRGFATLRTSGRTVSSSHAGRKPFVLRRSPFGDRLEARAAFLPAGGRRTTLRAAALDALAPSHAV